MKRWCATSRMAPFLPNSVGAGLIGGTGTGKSHLAIAIARACIRGGARGRFYNVVDLVNRLESEARAGRQGRMADYLSRFDFVVLDELGHLPFAGANVYRERQALTPAGGQLLFHLMSRLYERTLSERLPRTINVLSERLPRTINVLSERLPRTINVRVPSSPPTSPSPNGPASLATPR